MLMMPRRGLVAAAIAALVAVVSACGADPQESSADRASPTALTTNLTAEVAIVNYEVVAEEPSRFLVGLILPDNRLVAYGTVQMRFAQLDEQGQPTGQGSQVVTGTYLPLPGTESGAPSQDPQAVAPASVRGVYEIEGATFANPGPWTVEVAAKVEGVGVVQGRADFEVLAEPGVPGVGEQAPRSANPVIGDDVDARSLDSRAETVDAIPDPFLHRRSIADGMRMGKPVVVVFSTPVYCTSRFCGPVTDMIQNLEREYRGRATFVHVEVWQDFEENIVTETAGTWLLRGDSLNEPWLFILDDDGSISARWDNIFVRAEVEDGLDAVLGE
jgi:hypothetical protein